MVTFTERELRHRLEKRFGVSADALDLHPFTELRQSVRQDLELYRRSPFLRQDIPVRGFIYDVATAHFSEVYGRNKPLDTSG